MKARFTGKDSMGFKHGKVYDIYTKVNMIQRRMPVTGEIEYLDCNCLYDKESPAWCPYETTEAMLRNWEIFDSKMENK